MFQMPALVLSIIIASLCASFVYLWRGRNFRQGIAIWIAALIGFFIGQWLAGLLRWDFLRIGQVHPVEGIVAALLVAGIAARLFGPSK